MAVKLFSKVFEALRRYLDYTFEDDRNPAYDLFFQQNDKFHACTYSIFQYFYIAAMKELKDADGIEIDKTPYALKHTGASSLLKMQKQKGTQHIRLLKGLSNK